MKTSVALTSLYSYPLFKQFLPTFPGGTRSALETIRQIKVDPDPCSTTA